MIGALTASLGLGGSVGAASLLELKGQNTKDGYANIEAQAKAQEDDMVVTKAKIQDDIKQENMSYGDAVKLSQKVQELANDQETLKNQEENYVPTRKSKLELDVTGIGLDVFLVGAGVAFAAKGAEVIGDLKVADKLPTPGKQGSGNKKVTPSIG